MQNITMADVIRQIWSQPRTLAAQTKSEAEGRSVERKRSQCKQTTDPLCKNLKNPNFSAIISKIPKIMRKEQSAMRGDIQALPIIIIILLAIICAISVQDIILRIREHSRRHECKEHAVNKLCSAFSSAAHICHISKSDKSKAIAVVMSSLIMLSIGAGCKSPFREKTTAEEDGYENLGQDREITASESDSEAEQTKQTAMPPLEQLLDNTTGTYVGQIEVKQEKENALSGTLAVELTINENADKQLILSGSNGKEVKVYWSNDSKSYIIDDGNEPIEISFVFFDPIKASTVSYAKDALVENSMVLIAGSDPDTAEQMSIEFDNEKIFDFVCSILDSFNENYEDLYKNTANSEAFNQFCAGILGEYYDFSEGASRESIETLTEAIAQELYQRLFSDTSPSIQGKLIINSSDELSVNFAVSSENENGETLVTGNVKYTGSEIKPFEIPETEQSSPDNSQSE